MNKFLVRTSLAAILTLLVYGFCADFSRANAKPAAGEQEQALWDKITGLRKEAESFQREKEPPRPSFDANETDIRNYLKALELFNKDLLKKTTPVLDASEEYYSKYPKGYYAKENFRMLLILLRNVNYLNAGIMRSEDEMVYDMLCKDENLSAQQAGELFSINLSRLGGLIQQQNGEKKPDKEAVEALIDKMEVQMKEFGRRFKSEGELLSGQIWLAVAVKELFPQRSNQILKLAREYASDADKKILDGIIRGNNILGTKPEIKFKAIDGNEVDISKMQGKVVLSDFWATWCGPCMMELPNVLDVYRKYHSKGFEIIGISFDRDIESFKKVIKERGMSWPQYFDGKIWDNDFGVYFGIQGIPTMWLVDKDGKVVDTEPGGPQLGNKVKKLLGIEE
jgi:thiol-disulfide isomerase/thioredoxin